MMGKWGCVAARRDQKCLAVYGCTYEQLRGLREYGRELAAGGISRERQPIGAFARQRCNAKKRGIVWDLKLWEWWRIWQESGKWDERGRGDGFVMSRTNDSGPYAKGNVYIQSARKNNSERNGKKLGLPMGVVRLNSRNSKKGGNYGAHIMKEGKKVWLGVFDTSDAAEMAYLISLNT
jgi:hypothetical protein